MRVFKIISGLSLCLGLTVLPGCVVSSPPKPFSAEVSPTDPIAEIIEIKDRPVWVKFLNSSSEASAVVGTPLKVGESIRTEGSSRTQIAFKSGLVVRLEANAILTINPKNQIEITQGRAIARISADKNATVQIKTPVGTASISDATTYIDIPEDKKQEAHIFALQGSVSVQPNGKAEAIALKTGQDLAIKFDGVAAEPKTLDQAAIDKRFAQSLLLYGFNNKLDSQAFIEQDLKISNKTVKDPEKIPYKRPEKSNKATDTAANNNAAPSNTSSSNNNSANTSSARANEQPPVDTAPPPPVQEERPRNNAAVKPSNPVPVANPAKTAPTPVVPTQTVAEPPPLPVQPEVTPVEPPPVPVQPENKNPDTAPPKQAPR